MNAIPTMTAITFTVFEPPVAQARQKITTVNGHPRAYTPPKSAAYRELVRTAARKAMEGRAMLTGPLIMTVIVIKKAKSTGWTKGEREWLDSGGLMTHDKKPDADNHLKQICDALNDVVYNDDAQIVFPSVLKLQGRVPRTIITVAPCRKEFWTDGSVADLTRDIINIGS